MSEKPVPIQKIVINGEEVPPGKKVRMRDVGLDSDEIVRQFRESAGKK